MKHRNIGWTGRSAPRLWSGAGIAILAIACGNGASSSARESVEGVAQAVTGTCPSGNGYYVLYYGGSDSDIQTIRSTRPNFAVVANTDAQWPNKYHFDDPVNLTGPTGIKVLGYLATGYGTVNLDSAINAAMASGYDGIFFDQGQASATTYNAHNYNQVKGFGAGKIVIVNPGTADSSVTALFDAADIVSVENQYNVTLPAGFPAWRWLAVQGDPANIAATDQNDANNRLVTFRNNGGFWYYSAPFSSTESATHIHIPSWLSQFATLAKGHGDASCGGGSSSFSLNVNAVDLDHGNAAVNGMCVFVDGTSSCAGFTPYAATLASGNHTITATSFQANVFDHWDNGSNVAARAINLTSNTTLTEYYHTTSNRTVTVNALDLDHGNAAINGMCVFIDQTSTCNGFTPYTTSLPAGSHTITMTNFQNNVFNHWDNGSTSAARTVNVATDTTFNAYYHTL